MSDGVFKVENLVEPTGFVLKYSSSTATARAASAAPASVKPSPTRPGPRSTVHGPRCTVHGPRSTVPGLRSTVHGSRCTVHGSRSTVHDPRFTVHDRKSWESSGFHEIVAFAETEKFIDTPVVGTGLRTCPIPAGCMCGWRLGWRRTWPRRFCWWLPAAGRREVLSVGDAGSQKKCVGKMGGGGPVRPATQAVRRLTQGTRRRDHRNAVVGVCS